MMDILFIFAIGIIFGNLIYFGNFIIKLFLLKKKTQGDIYFIAPVIVWIYGVFNLIIIVGNLYIAVVEQAKLPVLVIALCIPIFTGIIIEFLILKGKNSIFVKNIICEYKDVECISFKETFIFNKLKIVNITRTNSTGINVFVSKKGQEIFLEISGLK